MLNRRRLLLTGGRAAILFSANYTGSDTPLTKGYTYTGGAVKYMNTTAPLLTAVPGTGVPRVSGLGYLSEASDINNFTISNGGFNASPWNFGPPTGATMSAIGALDPLGGTNAYTWTNDNSTGVHMTWGLPGVSSGSGTPYVGSIFLAPGASNSAAFAFVQINDDFARGAASSNLTVVFNLSTGVVTDIKQVIGTGGSGGRTPFSISIEQFGVYWHVSLSFANRGGNNFSLTFGTSDSGTPTYTTTGNQTRYVPTFGGQNLKTMRVYQSDCNNLGHPMMPIPTTTVAVTSVKDVATKSIAWGSASYERTTVVKQATIQAVAGGCVWAISDTGYEAALLQDGSNRYYFQVTVGATVTVIGIEPLSNVPPQVLFGVTVSALPRTTTLTVRHDAVSGGYAFLVNGVLMGQAVVTEPTFSGTQTDNLGLNAAQTLGANSYIQTDVVTSYSGSLAPAFSPSLAAIFNGDTTVRTMTAGSVAAVGARTPGTKFTNIFVLKAASFSAASAQSTADYDISEKIQVAQTGAIDQFGTSFGLGHTAEIAGAGTYRIDFYNAASDKSFTAAIPKALFINNADQVFIITADSATFGNANETFTIYFNGQCLTSGASPVLSTGLGNLNFQNGLIPDINNAAGLTVGIFGGPSGGFLQLADFVYDSQVCIAAPKDLSDTVTPDGKHWGNNAAYSIAPGLLNQIMQIGRLLDGGPTGSNFYNAQPDIFTLHGTAATATTNYGSSTAGGGGTFTIQPTDLALASAASAGYGAHYNLALFDRPYAVGAASPTVPTWRWSAPTPERATGLVTQLNLYSYGNPIAVGDMLVVVASIPNNLALGGLAGDLNIQLPSGFTLFSGFTKYDAASSQNAIAGWKIATSADLPASANTTFTGSVLGTTLTTSALTGRALAVGSRIAGFVSAGTVVTAILSGTTFTIAGNSAGNVSGGMRAEPSYPITWTLGTGTAAQIGPAQGFLANYGQGPAGHQYTAGNASVNYPGNGVTSSLATTPLTATAGSLIVYAFFDRKTGTYATADYVPGAGYSPRQRLYKAANIGWGMLADETVAGAGSTTARTVAVGQADGSGPVVAAQPVIIAVEIKT